MAGTRIERAREKAEKISPNWYPVAPIWVAYTGSIGITMLAPKATALMVSKSEMYNFLFMNDQGNMQPGAKVKGSLNQCRAMSFKSVTT